MTDLNKIRTAQIRAAEDLVIASLPPELRAAPSVAEPAGTPHSMAEDFDHFLSHSGFRNEPTGMIAKIRCAFEAAWEPAGTASTQTWKRSEIDGGWSPVAAMPDRPADSREATEDARALLDILGRTDWVQADVAADTEWHAAATCERVSRICKALLAATPSTAAAPRVDEALTLAYSLDEERYTEDLDDIMTQLDNAGNLIEGATYLVADVVRHKASDFTKGCADSVLEQARDAAFEAADEWADSFAVSVSQALRDDLERVVGEWADKNLPVTFWTVDKAREVEVTADDVRDYGSTDAAMQRATQDDGKGEQR